MLEQDSNLSAEDRQKTLQKLTTIVLSYNRRVDLTLNPSGQESTHLYPFKTDDFARLVDRNGPSKGSAVELAAERKKIEN